jgi:hypothetical protein
LVPLQQLRALRAEWIYPAYTSIAGLRLLHNLTQLRELELPGGQKHDVRSTDVVELLQALPHLHTLHIGFLEPTLPRGLVPAIGRVRPALRGLAFSHPFNVARALGSRDSPLFASLETLDVHSLSSTYDYARCVSGAESVAG